MNTTEIIAELKKLNIVPRVDGDELRLSGDTGKLTGEFFGHVKSGKEKVISFLKKAAGQLLAAEIPLVPSAENYPVSNAQKRIWALCQFDGGATAYNIVTGFYLKGTVIRENLEEAFQLVIKRHESLRTVFIEQGEDVRQCILDTIPFSIGYNDISGSGNIKSILETAFQTASASTFELDNGPLFSVKLFRLGESDYAVILVVHHIISDGWSMAVMMKDMLQFYRSVCKNEQPSAEPLSIQYKDYSAWFSTVIDTGRGLEAQQYWKQQFRAAVTPLNLPLDFVRPGIRSFKGALSKFYFDDSQYKRILSFCRQSRTTPFNFFRSVLTVMLYKFTSQKDVTIGTPVSGRNHYDLENQTGLYINTLPLRIEINTENTFTELLEAVSENSHKAFEHQEYPFDRILEDLSIQREAARNPLFDVMLVLQNTAVTGVEKWDGYGFELSKLDSYLYGSVAGNRGNVSSKFDLTFNIGSDTDSRYYLEIEYASCLFKAERIDALFNSFIYVAEQVIRNPEMPVCSITAVTPEERHVIMHEFNASISTIEEYHILDLFRESFKQNKNIPAVITDETVLSYSEVEMYSGNISAWLLQNRGASDNTFTGLLMNRTAWMIPCILGILKAGAAYVPVDTKYPDERISFIIEDAQPGVVIVDDKGLSVIPENYKGRVVHIDELKAFSESNSESFHLGQQDLREMTAYLIYTSGSTGTPKGVEICHRNTIAFLKWAREEFADTRFDILYAATSYCFDLSVFEFFFPLMQGKSIRLLDSALEIPLHICEDKNIMINTVPSVVKHLLEMETDWTNVAALNMAGEPIPKKIKEDLDFSVMEVRNLYGPSEDTTYSTVYRFDEGEYASVPIGKPVGYTHLYIMDENRNLLPAGVEGEIYLSGQSVAKGYFNRPELTAQRFLENPFIAGMTMYKTGDTGKWLPDGKVEYTGRIDDQVKVRGFRIELGEIQYLLEQHPFVERAVAIVSEVDSENHIVAYWVGTEDSTAAVLKEYVEKFLPVYMVPDYWISLKEIPLNSNGKVDRKRLPHPQTGLKAETEHIRPGTRTEKQLLLLWKEVLGFDETGITRNFFEAGGHSLKAARLRTLVYRQMNKELTVSEIFASPTIEKQALLIDAKSAIQKTSVVKSGEKEGYPLSSSQRRLWVLSQFDEASAAYNMPGLYVFEGELNIKALNHAFLCLIERHEILRTVFRETIDGNLLQFIKDMPDAGFAVAEHDVRGLPGQKNEVKKLVEAAVSLRFDLANGPLLRAHLYRIEDKKWVFGYVMHHIISDGWSMGILIRELLLFYNTYITGEINTIEPLKLQYKDYAAWQQEQLSNELFKENRDYWIARFSGELPVLNFPDDYMRPAVKTYNGRTITRMLNKKISSGIKQLSRQHDSTLFMGLVTAVNILLHRYTGQQDIIIGSPVAGRAQAEFEDQIGFYVNTIALRTQFNGEESYISLLNQVKELILGGYEHQAYPFDELVNELNLQHDTSRDALFNVMVILQNAEENPVQNIQLGNVKISSYTEVVQNTSKGDFAFCFTEFDNGLKAELEYNSDVYDYGTAERMLRHLEQLLNRIIKQPLLQVSQLDYLSESEKNQLLFDFNDTAVPYPGEQAIASLFERQVKETPDNTAVKFEEQSFTYTSLNEKANQFRDYLQKNCGILPGDKVGVKCVQSGWLIVAILGVLKSGAAYVPLDPDYSGERVSFMLNDSGCKILIDDIFIGELTQFSGSFGKGNLPVPAGADDTACVMYTSGSTGNPKGVLISNRGVIRLVKNCNYIKFTGTEVLLSVGSVSFDATVFEYWGMLLNGGCLVLGNRGTLPDAGYISGIMAKFKADTMLFSTGLFNELVTNSIDLFGNLKTVLTGGDKLSASHVNKLHEKYPLLDIINAYGLTENTTVSLSYRVTSVQDRIPAGKPVSNSTAYIIDSNKQLVPVGIAGEICVGGDGLAQGYLNNEALTAEKFIPNPFSEGKLMYRTGDMGRWLSDGNIEFFGRKDNQVKIKGYRVEPAEIERVLQNHPGIKSAVILAESDELNYQYLTAFIVPAGVAEIHDIRSCLSRLLPAYMIPDYFVFLDSFPLTANGKVNKKALCGLSSKGNLKEKIFISPRTEIERELALIWMEVLNKEQVSVKDNFFHLGGHSLKATRLISQVYKKFEVKIPLKEIFSHAVLEDQALLIEQSVKTSYINIEPAAYREYYPLSAAQKRLYFLYEFAPLSTSYNMPMVNYLGETVDKQRIILALEKLIARHENLRTSFVKIDGTGWQKVHQDVSFELDQHECLPGDFNAWMDAYIRPFDLGAAPLIRSAIVHVKGSGYTWIVDMHHIISDGTSHQVLANDFMHLYRDEKLPDLKLQYKDFSEWQNRMIEKGELSGQKEYWLSMFSDGVPVLNFPANHPRPSIFTFEGADYEFTLPEALTAKVMELGNRYNGTLQMTLLCVLNVLLHKYTGEDDIVVGSGIAGRRHPDVEGIVGMFVNSLAIRSFPSGDKSFDAFYKEVIATSIAAYENQDIQFEDLVDMLKVERDASRNPIFDISLIVQNFKLSDSVTVAAEEESGLVQLKKYDTHTSKFDMDWLVEERDDSIVITVEYYSAIYDRPGIERLTGHFINLLKTVLDSPGVLLSDINLLSDEEEKDLLDNYVCGGDSVCSADVTVDELFKQKAALAPGKAAVISGSSEMSYGELDESSDRLADFLRNGLNLSTEDKVGILQLHSSELAVSVMAVLKAGGAYVPMDSDYPEERLLYMLEDAGIEILLTDRKFIELANSLQWRSMVLKHLVCVDSGNFYSERGLLRNDLMRKDLWDHIGNVADDAIGQGGWINSFTGEDFSPAEMKEYSDNIYLKLKDHLHSNMRVLEIGCSSGLTMFQLAPFVESYYGTDLSSSILDKTQQAADERKCTNITLACMPAHEIDMIPEGDFDLVIINSVIQCFNGHNYLRDVLVKAISKMKQKGLLFIGDIMDEDKRTDLVNDMAAFKQLNRNPAYHTKTDWGMELFISRRFIDDIITDNIGIVHGEYSHKIHTISNELTRYRFDALLSIDKIAVPAAFARNKYQYDTNHINNYNAGMAGSIHESSNLACIIYTSGTTGHPKGVMIEHKALVLRFDAEAKLLNAKVDMVTCTTTNFSFDVSLLEVLFPLTMGGSIVVVSREQLLSPEVLLNELADKKVTLMQGTPSFVKGIFLDELSTENNLVLTHIAIGGESLNESLVRELKSKLPDVIINNQYGPTEAVIDAAALKNVAEFRKNIIGRPITDTRIYILGDKMQLLPAGVTGEICIGGPCLARGYLNREELTKEKFLQDPFKPGQFIYKTGDLGRYLPDLSIEFIGRKDHQVKIRGYRIEIGEIENVIMSYQYVDTVVVIARANKQGDKELAAYVTGRGDMSISDLRTHLGKTLPAYMVPGYFVQLDKLPLTANGKIDRRRLPDPEGLDISTGVLHVPPRNQTEEDIMIIWQDILDSEKIGMNDNFFEIGGHSLRVIRVLSRIRNEFGVDIKIEDMFSNPTIDFLAKEVARKKWASDSLVYNEDQKITITL
jgi:amino acid adenylation domain-containing protein